MLDLLDLPTPDEARRLLQAGGLPPEVVRFLPALQLLTLMRAIHGSIEQHFGRYGLSSGRFTLLTLLVRAPGGRRSPSELADRTRLTRATVTGLLDTLHKDGLVARTRDPEDRRRVVVELTEAGRTRLAEVLPDHLRRIGLLLSAMSDEDLAGLNGLTHKLRVGLQAFEED